MALKQYNNYAIAAAAFIVTLAILIVGVTTVKAAVVQTLDPGASGAQVSELQSFLATDSSIYPEGLVTGFYGPLTTAAVERFQCKYNIVCDGTSASTGYGRVGPMTLAKIESLQGSSASLPGIPNT